MIQDKEEDRLTIEELAKHPYITGDLLAAKLKESCLEPTFPHMLITDAGNPHTWLESHENNRYLLSFIGKKEFQDLA